MSTEVYDPDFEFCAPKFCDLPEPDDHDPYDPWFDTPHPLHENPLGRPVPQRLLSCSPGISTSVLSEKPAADQIRRRIPASTSAAHVSDSSVRMLETSSTQFSPPPRFRRADPAVRYRRKSNDSGEAEQDNSFSATLLATNDSNAPKAEASEKTPPCKPEPNSNIPFSSKSTGRIDSPQWMKRNWTPDTIDRDFWIDARAGDVDEFDHSFSSLLSPNSNSDLVEFRQGDFLSDIREGRVRSKFSRTPSSCRPTDNENDADVNMLLSPTTSASLSKPETPLATARQNSKDAVRLQLARLRDAVHLEKLRDDAPGPPSSRDALVSSRPSHEQSQSPSHWPDQMKASTPKLLHAFPRSSSHDRIKPDDVSAHTPSDSGAKSPMQTPSSLVDFRKISCALEDIMESPASSAVPEGSPPVVFQEKRRKIATSPLVSSTVQDWLAGIRSLDENAGDQRNLRKSSSVDSVAHGSLSRKGHALLDGKHPAEVLKHPSASAAACDLNRTFSAPPRSSKLSSEALRPASATVLEQRRLEELNKTFSGAPSRKAWGESESDRGHSSNPVPSLKLHLRAVDPACSPQSSSGALHSASGPELPRCQAEASGLFSSRSHTDWRTLLSEQSRCQDRPSKPLKARRTQGIPPASSTYRQGQPDVFTAHLNLAARVCFGDTVPAAPTPKPIADAKSTGYPGTTGSKRPSSAKPSSAHCSVSLSKAEDASAAKTAIPSHRAGASTGTGSIKLALNRDVAARKIASRTSTDPAAVLPSTEDLEKELRDVLESHNRKALERRQTSGVPESSSAVSSVSGATTNRSSTAAMARISVSQAQPKCKQPSAPTSRSRFSTSAAAKTKLSDVVETDETIAALLSAHNSKIRSTKATYQPRTHSLKDIRQWEEDNGKRWYELSTDQRIKANEAIEQRLKGTDHVAPTNKGFIR